MKTFLYNPEVAQLDDALRYKSKFAGLIPEGAFEIFHWLNSFGRTLAVSSSQAVTEMRTRRGGVKAAGALGWKPYHLHVSIVWKFWEPQPLGALRACNGITFTATIPSHHFYMYAVCKASMPIPFTVDVLNIFNQIEISTLSNYGLQLCSSILYFLIHSQMMVCWKLKPVHAAGCIILKY